MAIHDSAGSFGKWALLRQLGLKTGAHTTNTLPNTMPGERRGPDPHRAKAEGALGSAGSEPFPVDAYGHPKADLAPGMPKISHYTGNLRYTDDVWRQYRIHQKKKEQEKEGAAPGIQAPPKLEPMKLDKPPTAAESMEPAAQTQQPSQWDMQVKAPTVKMGASSETLRAYLAQRAAQSAGGAQNLLENLPEGATSREALGKLTGLQRHQLEGLFERGRETRRIEADNANNPFATRLRERLEPTLGGDIAPTGQTPLNRQGGAPLEGRAYDVYENDPAIPREYSPEHLTEIVNPTGGMWQNPDIPPLSAKDLGMPKPTMPEGAVDPLGSTRISQGPPITGKERTQLSVPPPELGSTRIGRKPRADT